MFLPIFWASLFISCFISLSSFSEGREDNETKTATKFLLRAARDLQVKLYRFKENTDINQA
jgi:hypothetical protein